MTVPLELYAMLSLFHYRRDICIGLDRPSLLARNLWRCYEQKKKQEVSRYGQAVYLYTQLELRRKEIKDIIRRVQNKEIVPNALEKAQKLEIEVQAITGLLEKLNYSNPEILPQSSDDHVLQDSIDRAAN